LNPQHMETATVTLLGIFPAISRIQQQCAHPTNELQKVTLRVLVTDIIARLPVLLVSGHSSLSNG